MSPVEKPVEWMYRDDALTCHGSQGVGRAACVHRRRKNRGRSPGEKAESETFGGVEVSLRKHGLSISVESGDGGDDDVDDDGGGPKGDARATLERPGGPEYRASTGTVEFVIE